MEWNSRGARFRRKTEPPPLSPAKVGQWTSIVREGLHPVNRDELDRILRKLDAKGAAGLSVDEKSFLDRFSSPL
jgi:hypothetical protein